MTDPKEEAKRIVEMFRPHSKHVIASPSSYIHSNREMMENAKQCAILHVDGLMKAISDNSIEHASTYRYKVHDHWIAVRQELEKM